MIIGITDRGLYPNEEVYLKQIDFFLNSSDVDYLIIREKDMNENAYKSLLEAICLRNRKHTHKIIVHTHINVAKAVGLKRVHLPEALLSRMDGEDDEIIYSLSLHPKTWQLDKRVKQCSFFLISPIYETSCKPGAVTLEPTLLKALKKAYNKQMVLLGGLDKDKIIALKNEGYKHFALRSGLGSFIQS